MKEWLTTLLNISGRYFVLASVSFLIFYVFFPKQFLKIKIQKLFPKPVHYYREIGFSTLSILIFSSIAYLSFVAGKPYNNIHYGSIASFGWVWFALGFVYMFFVHDAYFYLIHRFMHLPVLFKNVHLIHHKSTNPSPWTAYAFHPLEALLEAGIAPLIAFTLPVHKFGFILFMLFQIIYNIYGHLGFELYPKGFNKTIIGKWVNTGVAHNQHHKHFKGNYGLYTLIWDRLFGTLRPDYDAAYEQVK
jgi:Delta7-sterol 5-desaturase